MLGLTIATGVTLPIDAACNTSEYTLQTKKKDKKKPKFTVKGKLKMTVTKGTKVKIPKVTAKDNVDGNVTKKIKITVKKGKKTYKSIAKKIKNGKKVKFPSTGTYVITYTVTDKAGNKATKKRYVTVVSAKDKTTTEEEDIAIINEDEEITTTETPTTTESTTASTTTEEDNSYEINQVTVGGKTYNITDDDAFLPIATIGCNAQNPTITINIENDYLYLIFSESSGLLESHNYLNYLGDITATDKNGKDISNNIIIYENIEKKRIYIYVADDYGESLATAVCINLIDFEDGIIYDEDTFSAVGWEMLDTDPIVYGIPRSYISSLTTSKSTAKALIKKLESVM